VSFIEATRIVPHGYTMREDLGIDASLLMSVKKYWL